MRKEKKIMLAAIAVAVMGIGVVVYGMLDEYTLQRETAAALEWQVPMQNRYDLSELRQQEENQKLLKYGLHLVCEQSEEYEMLWGLQDKQGTTIIPTLYETIRVDETMGYVLCGESDQDYVMSYRYYAMDGSDFIKGSFLEASMFENGYACVTDGEKVGHIINKQGDSVMTIACESLFLFDGQKGLYTFAVTDEKLPQLGSRWGIINVQGEVILEPVYDAIEEFSDGRLLVTYTDEKSERGQVSRFLNEDFQPISEDVYSEACAFSEGLAPVKKQDKLWQVIDTEGTVVAEVSCEQMYAYSDGLAVIQLKNKWAAVNRQGETVFEIPHKSSRTIWFYMTRFSEGLLMFSGKGGLYGYIDTKGNIVIPAIFDYAEPFEDGVAAVSIGYEDGECGILKNPLKTSQI